MTSRPETFSNHTEYLRFMEQNCFGCARYREIEDLEFGMNCNACTVLSYLEIERMTDLSNRQAAYIDRAIINGVCQKRTTTKPRKYPKRPMAGQESLL